MRVTNDGDVPVRIVADARLLALDVTPRGAKTPVRCELPPDMRPADDLERPLVIPPRRSYAETFEPRLYCFGEKKLDALASGTIVEARLGWTRPSSQPPFEVSAIDGIEPLVTPERSIAAAPIALPDDPTPAPRQTPLRSVTDDSPHLALTSPKAIDAESSSALQIPVTLRNEGSRTVIVEVSPATFRFDVSAPTHLERCVWPAFPGAPTRESFTHVPPHGTASLTLILADYCDPKALEPGLLLVRARLDTRKASGDSIGLRTFDGEVVATSPTLVRLHGGQGTKPIVRPRLEPPEAAETGSTEP